MRCVLSCVLTPWLKNCVLVGDVQNSGSCTHLPVKAGATAVNGAPYVIELEALICDGFVGPRYQGVYKLFSLYVKASGININLSNWLPLAPEPEI